MTTTSIDAIIFDCDGVLVDSEPITNRVLMIMLNELGIEFDLEQTMATFVGKSVLEQQPNIAKLAGSPLPDDWYQEFLRRRDVGLRKSVVAIPGIADVIEHLHNIQMPFAVASGAESAKMRLTLGRCELLTHFEDYLFGADMVARSKPAPDVYLMAMRALRVDPAKVIVIEDTPTGTSSGVAAGATVFGFAERGQGQGQSLLAMGAKLVFSKMEQLPDLIKQHQAGN